MDPLGTYPESPIPLYLGIDHKSLGDSYYVCFKLYSLIKEYWALWVRQPSAVVSHVHKGSEDDREASGHLSNKTMGWTYMGGCQNYGPFLGTLNNRCRIVIGTQKGTIILTTTHIKKSY